MLLLVWLNRHLVFLKDRTKMRHDSRLPDTLTPDEIYGNKRSSFDVYFSLADGKVTRLDIAPN